MIEKLIPDQVAVFTMCAAEELGQQEFFEGQTRDRGHEDRQPCATYFEQQTQLPPPEKPRQTLLRTKNCIGIIINMNQKAPLKTQRSQLDFG